MFFDPGFAIEDAKAVIDRIEPEPPVIGHLSVLLLTPAYSLSKIAGNPPNDTPPSFQEMGAGLMGFSASLSLLPSGNLEFATGRCECE